ncbi:CDP-glucose 4,6-dehydratase [Fluviispira multicolorata]|uniref:CDP-glucose 4,6-dehydratase n=1 Tax=Fluviispira multicolorata TaxID=2654512 RepID=A0A833N2D8_9BACT|nr:CDP-glucose 4,6-dehydratase [Fluviispira multicolorata]KAB8028042.1 CDP-glucose 4,6-dehydratase [Fluviispira multicolorata]
MNLDLFDFYSNKKILITGHTGFKGAWLAIWLQRLGAHVIGYALEPEYEDSLFEKLNLVSLINHNIGDIRDFEKLNKLIAVEKPEIIFHLAAQAIVHRSYDDPLNTYSTNVMGSANILESIRNSKSVRVLVYITSDKCYWNNEWTWGYRENDLLGGTDPYSASKACAEHVFKSYYLSFFKEQENFACSSARAGNVIGGGDRARDRIVPDIVKSIETGTPIVLRNPNSTRPWQHVLDPLHGYIMLAKVLYQNPKQFNGESWNFGPTNQSIKTVHDLTNIFIKLWDNAEIKVEIPQNKFYESNLLHLSIDKANSLLKWFPKYKFSEAVLKTGEWYKQVQNGEDPKTETLNQIEAFMSYQ